MLFRLFDLKARFTSAKFPFDLTANFVISIASYPKRDHLLPAVFEALRLQTVKPQKAILVLSKEDYSDTHLPKHVQRLEKKGIEILWTKKNPYAVKKLVPVVEKYPEMDVITFDDENLYGSKVIEKLILARNANAGLVIGHYGKALHRIGNNLNMQFRFPEKASKETPSIQVYLIGNAGILYPADSLDHKVLNLDAISAIVPGRGSDIWFWAAAISKGTKQLCLGTPNDRKLYVPIPQNKKTAPKDTPGVEVLESRFQSAIDYFGIREKLVNELPDVIA